MDGQMKGWTDEVVPMYPPKPYL